MELSQGEDGWRGVRTKPPEASVRVNVSSCVVVLETALLQGLHHERFQFFDRDLVAGISFHQCFS